MENVIEAQMEESPPQRLPRSGILENEFHQMHQVCLDLANTERYDRRKRLTGTFLYLEKQHFRAFGGRSNPVRFTGQFVHSPVHMPGGQFVVCHETFSSFFRLYR